MLTLHTTIHTINENGKYIGGLWLLEMMISGWAAFWPPPKGHNHTLNMALPQQYGGLHGDNWPREMMDTEMMDYFGPLSLNQEHDPNFYRSDCSVDLTENQCIRRGALLL